MLEPGVQGMATQASPVKERPVGRRGSVTVDPASPKGEKKLDCCVLLLSSALTSLCVSECMLCIAKLFGIYM